MTSKHPLKFSAINLYFANNKRLLDRGENAYESGHVVKIEFKVEHLRILGSVNASMKNKTYSVKVILISVSTIRPLTNICFKDLPHRRVFN